MILSTQNPLVRAYSLIKDRTLFESAWVRRQFSRAYFFYKEHVESPYAGLVRLHPELFRGGHILDIGANIGYTATLFAKVVAPQFKIYAFEPDPTNFAMLGETINESPYQNKIVPVHAAIGQQEGMVELWRDPTSHGDRRVCTPEFKGALLGSTPDLVRVPLLSIDGFFASEQIYSPPCFMKIRVQGYELPVFLGMQRTLDSNPDLIVAFMYLPGVMKLLGFEPRDLIEFFISKGFEFYTITRRGRVYALPNPMSQLNSNLLRKGYVELLLSRKPLAL